MVRRTYIAPAAWDALRQEYVEGKGRVRELAEKHGINPGTAEQRAKRERWTAQRSEFLSKKREMMSNPTAVLNPPNGHLPPAMSPPDSQNFTELNERYHSFAGPLLLRIEEGLNEMALPQTPSERQASANANRTLIKSARELLGIPLVSPIKRREMRRMLPCVADSPEPVQLSTEQSSVPAAVQ